MPAVLVIVFAVALIFTVLGLFLSSRSASRRSQNEYLVTRKGRAIVESTVVPEHPRQPVAESSSSADIMRRRVRLEDDGEIYTKPLTRRASVPGTSTTAALTERTSIKSVRPKMAPVTRQYASVRVRSTDLAYPDPWGDLKGYLNSWKVGAASLAVIALLGLCLLSASFSHSVLWMPVSYGQSNQPPPTPAPANLPTYTASQHLMRLGQLDPAQYQSMQEFNTWAYSACSAASMTEVINSYGHSYRVTDILKVESGIHEITPQLGLLEEVGIQRTGALFGFKTTWGHNLSLDQVIAAANSGTPVIVSFPPYKFAGGHILVVRGGNNSVVDLADSSRLDWTQLSRDRFMQLWGGFSAIMTPA